MEKATTFNFTKCPCCGSESRLALEVLRREKERGKLKDMTNAFLFQHQSLIANPDMRFLSAPVILTFYDACSDCGTVYLVHAEVQTAVQGMAPAKPKYVPPTHNN